MLTTALATEVGVAVVVPYRCRLAGWRYMWTVCIGAEPLRAAGDVPDRGVACRRGEGTGLQRRSDKDQPYRAGQAATGIRGGRRADEAVAEVGSGAVVGEGSEDGEPAS